MASGLLVWRLRRHGMDEWQSIWKRLTRGEHIVLSGTGTLAAPDPAELHVVVVECEAFPEPLAPLEEARRQLARVLGTPGPTSDDRFVPPSRGGFRESLLGEGAQVDVARYLEAFSGVPRAAGVPVALVLRGIDRADEETLALLTRLVHATRPKLPLLLSFESGAGSPAARRFFKHLSHVLPQESFHRAPGAEHAALGVGATAPPLRALPAPMLRTLRAAAILGDLFESEVLAELLGEEEISVLATLQAAVDLGFSIEDRGHGGVFRLEGSLARALRESTLPSLSRAWHERLARLFGGLPAPLPPAAPAPLDPPAPVGREVGAAPASAPDGPQSSAEARSACIGPEPARQVEPTDGRPDAWYERLGAALMSAPAPAGRAATSPPAAARTVTRRGGGVRRHVEQRAAKHAEAAGLWDAAYEQHLSAAEQASRTGSHHAAIAHAARACKLAEQLRDPERARQSRLVSMLVTARASWQSRGSGPEASLEAAVEVLLECRSLSRESDPLELRAEVAMLLAAIQYDIGTAEALERALAELATASQLLLDAGQPLDAARLLNDEAAIWVKLGDPVRANYLLSRSLEVFGKVASSYAPARAELAETEHLLARLLLQATARPGRERDALQLGVAHGRAAEQAYHVLNDAQRLGRVWETLARLHLRLGELDVAARLLEDARRVQEQLGDGVGLARSAGAASEVALAARDYPAALERLSSSIHLNAEKGLRAGLEFNRASLRRLEASLPFELREQTRVLEQRVALALGSGGAAIATP